MIGDVDNPGNAGLAQGQIALGDLGHLMGMARLGGGQQASCNHQVGALLPFQLDQPLGLGLLERRPLIHRPGARSCSPFPTVFAEVVGVERLTARPFDPADALRLGIGVGATACQLRPLWINHREQQRRLS